MGAPMKGSSPPEVLNLIPRHPCTYPNRCIQPYAPHSISMPLGGVRQAKKASRERGHGARIGLVVFFRSCNREYGVSHMSLHTHMRTCR